MPSNIPFRPVAICVSALILALLGASSAAAKSVSTSLRVVTTSGKVLADQGQYTDSVHVKTDKGANCFGAGTGGSGKTATIKGATALGAVVDAAAVNPALRPVSLTDSFSFGLGVCGFGGFEPKSSSGFWYLKVNHKGAQVGGDALKVKPGDDVLWYLADTFPAPEELALSAPAAVKPDLPFTVRVWRYDDAGKRKPAKGASVSGADAPTGADGTTTVSLAKGAALTARLKGLIPSAAESVCVRGSAKPCPGGLIGGSAGPDRINARNGRKDRVNCGAGKDVALLDSYDVGVKCETKKVS